MCDIKFGLDKRVDFIHAIVCSYVIKNLLIKINKF